MTGKGSTPTDEMLHSGSLKIRGGTPAQEMSLGKRQIPEGIIYLLYVLLWIINYAVVGRR